MTLTVLCYHYRYKISTFSRLKKMDGMERPHSFILCECDIVVGKKYDDEDTYVLDDDQLISYLLGDGCLKKYSINELEEEIGKLQKFCVYLYNRINKK